MDGEPLKGDEGSSHAQTEEPGQPGEQKQSSGGRALETPSAVRRALRRIWEFVRKVYVRHGEVRPKLELAEYKIHIDLYKFYIDLVLKVNVFFFAIVGTILAVIYKDGGTPAEVKARFPVQVLKVFLLTPFYLSIIGSGAFFLGCYLWGRLTNHINRALERGDFKLHVPPFTHVLTCVLFAFGAVYALVACFLCSIIWLNEISILPFR